MRYYIMTKQACLALTRCMQTNCMLCNSFYAMTVSQVRVLLFRFAATLVQGFGVVIVVGFDFGVV